eukprot:3375128-Lingulodinium_polyedra.AAC.1
MFVSCSRPPTETLFVRPLTHNNTPDVERCRRATAEVGIRIHMQTTSFVAPRHVTNKTFV